MATQRDLSLAYSPGVAVPVRAIADDPGKAYDLTAKGNLVAVISNGTAILGLGNLGALASKPVMEGKAVLFKRFADVDSIDIEVDDRRRRSASSKRSSCSSRASAESTSRTLPRPTASSSSRRCKERMNIPVFHDDQHGTAIITAAGLINACHLTGREFKDIRVVVNGAGAAAIACTELIKAMGVRGDHVIMCDRKGVDPQRPHRPRPVEVGARGRDRRAHARRGAGRRRRVPRPVGGGRAQARDGRGDGQGADHLRHGQSRPGDLRRPTPRRSRPDAIIATGRSDYPEPGQQRPRLPLHLPRRARRSRDRDQRGDEDRRRRSAGRAGARAGAGGSRGGLWRAQPQLRPRLHHPRAVRSAADGSRRLAPSPKRR